MKPNNVTPMPTLGRDAATAYLDIVHRRAERQRKDKRMKDLYIAFMTTVLIIMSIVLALTYLAIR